MNYIHGVPRNRLIRIEATGEEPDSRERYRKLSAAEVVEQWPFAHIPKDKLTPNTPWSVEQVVALERNPRLDLISRLATISGRAVSGGADAELPTALLERTKRFGQVLAQSLGQADHTLDRADIILCAYACFILRQFGLKNLSAESGKEMLLAKVAGEFVQPFPAFVKAHAVGGLFYSKTAYEANGDLSLQIRSKQGEILGNIVRSIEAVSRFAPAGTSALLLQEVICDLAIHPTNKYRQAFARRSAFRVAGSRVDRNPQLLAGSTLTSNRREVS